MKRWTVFMSSVPNTWAAGQASLKCVPAAVALVIIYEARCECGQSKAKGKRACDRCLSMESKKLVGSILNRAHVESRILHLLQQGGRWGTYALASTLDSNVETVQRALYRLMKKAGVLRVAEVGRAARFAYYLPL